MFVIQPRLGETRRLFGSGLLHVGEALSSHYRHNQILTQGRPTTANRLQRPHRSSPGGCWKQVLATLKCGYVFPLVKAMVLPDVHRVWLVSIIVSEESSLWSNFPIGWIEWLNLKMIILCSSSPHISGMFTQMCSDVFGANFSAALLARGIKVLNKSRTLKGTLFSCVAEHTEGIRREGSFFFRYKCCICACEFSTVNILSRCWVKLVFTIL